MRIEQLFVVFAIVLGTLAHAHEGHDHGSNNQAVRSMARSSELRGTRLGGVPVAQNTPYASSLELRPSWKSATGWVGMENLAEVGVRVSTGFQVSYLQEFNVNLQNPSGTSSAFSIHNGYLKGRLDSLLKSVDGSLSLSLDPVFYLPTDHELRQAGFVTGIRNDIRFAKRVSNSFILSATESPIFYVYSQSGTNATGDFRANPLFENRISLTSDFLISERVTLSIPLIFAATRYAYYKADTISGDRWGYSVRLYPELSYIMGNHSAVGLAFNSDSIVARDFSALTIGDGFSKSTLQLILQAWI